MDGMVTGFSPPMAAIRSVQLPQNEQFLVADSMWINTGEVGFRGKVCWEHHFFGGKIAHCLDEWLGLHLFWDLHP